MRTVWPMKLLADLLKSDPGPAAIMPSLPEVVEQARCEWLSARRYYNSVSDSDLVDHAAYLMLATEKKYVYLLKKARREGVSYSPFSMM